MNITELDSYRLADAVKFHNRLNPKIWGRDEQLLPEVRSKLMEIAADFQEFLGISDLDIQDITFSGSNAAYSYTPHSDIDLHLVVNVPKDEVYQELFNAKKYQYNDMHDIRVRGADVELYVQPADEPAVSLGEYSVLNNKWLEVPKRKRARIDQTLVRHKYEDVKARIESALKENDSDRVQTLINKIKAMRQAGLNEHGEFGPENLAFKMLRRQGWIEKLYNHRAETKDRELSLKEQPKKPFRYGYGTDASDYRALFKPSVPKAPPTNTDVQFNRPQDYEWYQKQQAKKKQLAAEGHQGQPYSSEDGVAPSTCMFLNEEEDSEKILHQFIEWAANKLGITEMPKIIVHTDPEWSVENHSFGRYEPDTHSLHVNMANRHLFDVLRTTAHELAHCRQNQVHPLPDEAGETGSQWENEAHAAAGIIMRDFADAHPELFDTPAISESASGYIPTKKQAKDPRYSMALTVDIKPGQVGKEANKLKLATDSQGRPGLLMKTTNIIGESKINDLNDPPGPEFRPTMPRGTVRVDVSDVYDWYKLGKHIADLGRASADEFGKGPPSTIVSFGDEETEHKYIKNLEKLGLKTTDIDPKDPNQPVGLPRQSTDPTYNVDEEKSKAIARTAQNLVNPPKIMQHRARRDQEREQQLKYRDTAKRNENVAEGVNDYLWHGSRQEHSVLYPQQAQDTGGKEESNKNAIYATPNAKVAIAMGLTTPGSDTGMFPNDQQMVLFRGGIRKGEMVYLHKVPKDLFIKHNSREWYSQPDVQQIKPIEVVKVPVDKFVHLIRQATPQDLELQKKYMKQPALAEDDLVESLRQEFALLEDEYLGEIKMSPSSLRQEAAKTGAQAGMEFEMIVPNVNVETEPEYEPDMDQDTRSRDFDDIRSFFHDGDYNSRRDVDRLIDSLQEQFDEWGEEQIYEAWADEGQDYMREYIETNDYWDEAEAREEATNELEAEYGDKLSKETTYRDNDIYGPVEVPSEFETMLAQLVKEKFDEFVQQQWDDQDQYYEEARDQYFDEQRGEQSEREWLNDTYPYMSDIQANFDIQWPYYYDINQGDGEMDIDTVANDFEEAIGRPVNASSSYHGATREKGKYVVEPDGSLDPDDSDDGGLEFVSPPMPIDELINDLNKVKAWADSRGCYTNDSTGLHINISVPDYSLEKLDYIKLALLMGDQYVLDQFGRAGNTYTKSAMGKIRDKIKQQPERAQEFLDKMRSGMGELASKAIHSGTTDKYTSINTKSGYIEFRSPGGDWLDANFDKIENTLLRFTVALSAAINPQAYRQEYLKKLYKLLEVKGTGDPLSYFARYAAGELNKSELRDFVKQAQLQRKIDKDPTGGQQYWWEVSRPGYFASIQVVASSKEEAVDKAIEPGNYPDWASAKNTLQAKPIKPFDSSPVRASVGEPQPVGRPTGAMLGDRPSNPEGNWVISPENDRSAVAYRFMAADRDDAALVARQWRQANPGQVWIVQRDDNRTLGQPAVPGSTVDLQRQRAAAAAATGNATNPLWREPQSLNIAAGREFAGWRVLLPSGEEVYQFSGVGNSQADANRIAADWLRRNGMGVSGEGYEVVPMWREA